MDAAAVSSLVSGLGGAVIGAATAVYLASRQHRRQQQTQVVDYQRERARSEAMMLTEVRTKGKAWLEVLRRAVQNLDAGVAVDLDRFDTETLKTSFNHYQVVYKLEMDDYPPVDDLVETIHSALDQLTRSLREVILTPSPGRSYEDMNCQVTRIAELRTELNVQILERVARLLGAHDTGPTLLG
ncbi:hypothetical protein [Streptomyces sp. NPDC020951]|uniref:hypothetical protein n=1 Tax=Streptomyces sp. NPDC020951 TaxID=3365104 RepID=UPI003791D854